MSKPDARVVGWMTPGGDMSKSRVWCDERCMPPSEPIPLAPLSLLAEAESRLVSNVETIRELEVERIALQSRLDAVGALADRMEEIGRANWTHPKRKKFAENLRSAALGGESPANEEERK